MIILAVAVVPALLGLVGAHVAPQLSWRMAPATAAVTLTGFALTVSLVTGVMLCTAGCLAAAELFVGVRPRDWAVATLRHEVPVPPSAGVVAGTMGVVLLALALCHLVRLGINARNSSSSARALPCIDGLTIVDDQSSYAFAVPGRHARVVVSTALLRSLTAPQRRAVLEHERAHLRRHHHVYAQLSRLAAAANPLMRPVARAVDVALERWADAEAARAIGDRVTVARALAAVALPTAPLRAPSLGAAQCAVVERVQYLLQPPPRNQRGSALMVAAAVLCWLCLGLVLLGVHDAIELAEAASWR